VSSSALCCVLAGLAGLAGLVAGRFGFWQGRCMHHARMAWHVPQGCLWVGPSHLHKGILFPLLPACLPSPALIPCLSLSVWSAASLPEPEPEPA
jgi:hypothetical protein